MSTHNHILKTNSTFIRHILSRVDVGLFVCGR